MKSYTFLLEAGFLDDPVLRKRAEKSVKKQIETLRNKKITSDNDSGLSEKKIKDWLRKHTQSKPVKGRDTDSELLAASYDYDD